MTRSPQELAQPVWDELWELWDKYFADASDNLFLHEPKSAEALKELVALAEAGERAQEALRRIANREVVTRPLGQADGVQYVEPMTPAAIARAALGEGS